MTNNDVVTPDAWTKARKELLEKEKALTRMRDEISALRRDLPWVKVEKEYVFEGTEGRATLGDLFAGRSQLIVQHFMFGPEWEEGCPSCSYWADNFNGTTVHLEHRDISLVAVSRAPLAKLQAYRERMGWDFRWVSSVGDQFSADFHVCFTPEQLASSNVYYNYRKSHLPGGRCAGGECLLSRRRGRRLPHLLVLRARPRHLERCLPLHGPGAEGPR